MISLPTELGTVKLTSDYFANLVGSTAVQCFGVSEMATSGPIEGMRSVLFGRDYPEKGVKVYERDGRLVIDLHIIVTYGTNIAAIVKSISQKVKYAVEQATGLSVMSINVYVDDMVAE